jgi:hypothetical protein
MKPPRSLGLLAASTIVAAWAGMAIHDLYELPALVPGSPQFTLPSAVYGVLGVAWLVRPSAVTRGLLAGWLGLNLVGGGILSVLPLPFLPFVPEQSVAHYAVHAVYAVAQIPGLWFLAQRRSSGAPAPTDPVATA